MKLSLIYTPYFTNGDYPPLGASYIAAALKELGGHDVIPHDFQWSAYKESLSYLEHFRKLECLAMTPRDVSFILRPDLVVYSLYRNDYKGFKWAMPSDSVEKAAWGAFSLMLEDLSEKWAKVVIEDETNVILFSTYISNVFSSLSLAKAVKRLDPDKRIIFGGPGVGLVESAEFVLKTGFVDAVIMGEGEMSAVELMKAMEDKNFIPENIPGVAVIKDGAVVHEPREQVTDIDSLPIPDFEGFPHPGMSVKDYLGNKDNRYRSPFFEGVPILSTRGCINRCAYCSETVYWKKFRQRSPEKVAKELEQKRELTDSDVFLFCDSTLNARRDWLIDFSDAVAGQDYKFLSYMIASDTVDKKVAKAISRAGFKGITIGVETFSERLLKLVRKNTTREQIESTISLLVDEGIHVKVNVLCGFPTETEDDVMESVNAIEELSKKSSFDAYIYWDAGHPVRVEPYSDFYANPDKYGISFQRKEIPLPDELKELSRCIDKISLTWDPGFGRDVVKKRSALIKQAASRQDE